MAIITKIKHIGQRMLGYGLTVVELWFEGTRFSRTELKFL